MIRRQKSMRFLGGYYAFPGGKVDAADGAPEALERCRGLDAEGAARCFPERDGVPPLAFWVTAARELLEETGVLAAGDREGRPIRVTDPGVAARVEAMRRRLLADEQAFAALLDGEGWYLDLAPFRYLSHFITPPSSPIRFTARFFLAPLPEGQSPRLFTEETSEGFWVNPADGVTRYQTGEMPMAEPADSALRYLSGFESLAAVWLAHGDRRHKFHGVFDDYDPPGVWESPARRHPL
jgi:8-oxo-dGTP pyrophosphatase MutT (NUDIX family)